MKEFLMRAYLVDINQNGIRIKGTVYISPSEYGKYQSIIYKTNRRLDK